jgi:hypothetical protein
MVFGDFVDDGAVIIAARALLQTRYNRASRRRRMPTV